jgi:hypothetical protein
MASPRPGRRPSLVPTVSVGKAPRPAPGQDAELAALHAGEARPKHPNTPDAGAKIHAAISGAKSLDDTHEGVDDVGQTSRHRRVMSCLVDAADLPLSRIKDHRPMRAIPVSLPAGTWSVAADGQKYTGRMRLPATPLQRRCICNPACAPVPPPDAVAASLSQA